MHESKFCHVAVSAWEQLVARSVLDPVFTIHPIFLSGENLDVLCVTLAVVCCCQV